MYEYTKKEKFSWIRLIVFILVIEFIGSLSAFFAGDIKAIYNHLSLPALSPPTYLFGIVWPILYALIGISGYLIYQQVYPKHIKLIDYSLFLTQLILNFVWSIIFFKVSAYWLGFLIIIVLDLVVLSCIIHFYKNSRLASILMVPYLIWIIFASYLTLNVAILN
ncbi:TspO/MBR family protein [Liquorilactobacillus nagelii]|jgi:tryptophan-rich sensory protein|uniref:TspO/MBR family protein n=1 Tax=Liquorilactobacillus nagelii TaxID=82688 RepID=UPI0039E877DD